MTSTELATTTNGRDLATEKEFAVALAGSDLLPKQYHGKPANVLVAMEWAYALGVPPMVAMQQLYIIDGKPTASAKMIAGLVRRAGHNVRLAGDDARAVCEITRNDDPEFVFKSIWTIERAQKAGLTGKSTWKQYPAQMLKARALTEAATDACPEALLGVATRDEVEDHQQTTPPAVSTAHLPRTTRLSGAVTGQVEPDPVADEDGVVVDPEPEQVSDAG